jgi:hypothetical protein
VEGLICHSVEVNQNHNGEPIRCLPPQLDAAPLSQAAKKLTFRLFVRVLLFRLFSPAGSLGNLVLDLRTKAEACVLGLPNRTLAVLDLSLETLSTLAWLTRCRDEIIQLTRDEAKTVLRLVSFQCGTHRFHLVTNRVELTTAQVIRLYSWRGPRGVALSRVATHCRSLTPDQLE